MNEYTASNGVKIRRHGDAIEFPGARLVQGLLPVFDGPQLLGDIAVALREFFRAEEDERLGRWRDPNTSGYVAYDRGEGYVRVVREVDGTSEVYIRSDVDQPGGLKPAIVAKAFFDAHPEPKPGHDAQESDVWVIEYNGNEYPAIFQAGMFRGHGGAWPDDSITDARRIYPEASDD